MIVKHEKQILIILHHFQELLRPFSLYKVADSNDFHSNTSSQDPQNKIFDLKFWSHTQEKGKIFFLYFLHHFYKNSIFI